MNPKVKITFEGETVDAEEMRFEVLNDAPLRYRVSDDAITIEMKHEIKNIYRLCDKKKPDGSAIYVLTGATALRQLQPDELPQVEVEK